MNVLTPTQEQAIRERLAAATDGPWFVEYESEECPPFKPYAHAIHGPTMQGVLESQVSDDFKARYGHQMDEVAGVADTDAELIAHAPTDLADLLAELDRLRGKLADAWDEGFDAGEANENHVYWNAEGTGVTNPYREGTES